MSENSQVMVVPDQCCFADDGVVEIEILVVPDCPNEKLAAERLRSALDEIGRSGTTFTIRVVADQAEAEAVGFTGSPTILVNGRDPFAEPGHSPALACRVYRTPEGLAGVPSLDQVRRALSGEPQTDRESGTRRWRPRPGPLP